MRAASVSCALRLKTQGPPGGDLGHRVAALGNRWGMAGRRGLVGQGQGTGCNSRRTP